MSLRAETVRSGPYFARVIKREGCWGWKGFIDNKGYGRLNVQGAKPRSQGAHRVSWVVHNGDIPTGMHVLHSCDNPICTNPDHLRLGTHADNMRDKEERGRANRTGGRPERARAAKLDWDKVREIRAIKAGCPTLCNAIIGAQFNVTASTISYIVTGKTWREAVEPVQTEMRR